MTKLRLGVHTLRIQTGKYENKVEESRFVYFAKETA